MLLWMGHCKLNSTHPSWRPPPQPLRWALAGLQLCLKCLRPCGVCPVRPVQSHSLSEGGASWETLSEPQRSEGKKQLAEDPSCPPMHQINGGEAQVLTGSSQLLLLEAEELCVVPGKVLLAAGGGPAANGSFSCKSENPLQISCNCQKQVLNVGFFYFCFFFFLIIYLAAPGLSCGMGDL